MHNDKYKLNQRCSNGNQHNNQNGRKTKMSTGTYKTRYSEKKQEKTQWQRI